MTKHIKAQSKQRLPSDNFDNNFDTIFRKNNMKVYAWSDGTFVEEDDFCEIEYASFGDDYMIINIPDDILDCGKIDEYILLKVNGK